MSGFPTAVYSLGGRLSNTRLHICILLIINIMFNYKIV